ncbi:MAG: hypothetical protein V1702_03270 [Candidatus Woesearchaeota archaeon]
MSIWTVIVMQTKFLTTIDDYIRLVTMTLLMIALALWIGAEGIWFTLLLTIGVAIDVHDLAEKAIEGKPFL